MNHYKSPSFHRLWRALLPALLLWGYALQAQATPVFELLQGLKSSPEYPSAKLIQVSDGDFYGTTRRGGSSGFGTVFQMTASGTLTTLVNFIGTNGGLDCSVAATKERLF